MRKNPGFLFRSRLSWLGLAMAAGIAGCSSGPDEPSPLPSIYSVIWRFINTGPDPVNFGGQAVGQSSFVDDVGPGCSARDSTLGRADSQIPEDVKVYNSGGAEIGRSSFSTIPRNDGDVITVTANWSGTALSVAASKQNPSPVRAAGAGDPVNVAVKTCPPWKLDGITGSASANWLDIAATADGTLTFSVPQEVEPGQTYPVSATFSGSITVNPGWSGYSSNVTVGINDRGIPGLVVNNSANTGRLDVGTFSQAVTVNGTWVIPSNSTTLAIEASGGWAMAGPGNANPPKLVATYSRKP